MISMIMKLAQRNKLEIINIFTEDGKIKSTQCSSKNI